MLSTKVTREKSNSINRSKVWKYIPRVRVSYRVAERAYTTDRLRIGDYGLNTRKEAQKVLSGYKRGSQALVYHHPDQPDRAVLEPGTYLSNTWKLGVGLGMLLLGLFTLLLVRPRRQID